jgi:NADH-quinone oxidoreductase subunit M
MIFEHVPWVSMLVAIPAIGALLTLAVANRASALGVARAVAVIELGLGLGTVLSLDRGVAGFQLVDRAPWIPWLGVDWHVGLDGVSAPFVVLAPLLAVAALAQASPDDPRHGRGFAASILVMLSALVGIYTSLDVLLFFGFWELSVAPLFVLVGLWGDGGHRRHSATRTLLTLLGGGVPLLLGILVLANGSGGFETDLPALLARPIPPAVQRWALPLLALGFAVKAPAVPFHGWMPDVVSEGPVGVGVLVMGLKLGVWGVLRFLGTCPVAAREMAVVFGVVGVVGAVYGALLALRQTELRRLVAWLGVSHVGVAVLGISTLSIQGLEGALAMLVSFALVSAGLLVVGGALFDRFGSTDVSAVSALAVRAPRLTTALVVLGVGALGTPGTVGFVGEHLTLVAAFAAHPALLLLALPALPFGAAALLSFGSRVLGGAARPTMSAIADLDAKETAIALTFAGLMVVVGLAPNLLVQRVDASAAALAASLAPPTPVVSWVPAP